MEDKLRKSTGRIHPSSQSLEEAYSPPANFLEIEVCNPQDRNVIGSSSKRYTEYEIRLKSNLPTFEKSESIVYRRYSDFVWLRKEIAKTVKITLASLPEEGLLRQIPFLSAGIFEEEFIRERQAGLDEFINSVACHPLVQSEACLHLFLQGDPFDKNAYVPAKIKFKKNS